MRRNLVSSLFEHETVSTTLEKAKEVKPFAEKLITLAKKGTLAARRQVVSLLGNRDIIEYEDGSQVRKGTVIGKLFSDIAPRYLDRPGGYTRIIRLSLHRLGDSGSLVLLQLVGQDEKPKKKSRSKKAKKKEVEVKEAIETGTTSETSQADQVQEMEESAESSHQEDTQQSSEKLELKQDEAQEESEKPEEQVDGEKKE
jgi:large subunit ribosomal protein L17